MHVIIAGNGIAGSTAAHLISQGSDHHITMISDEAEYPFARTALMYVFMGHLRLEDTKLYQDHFWAATGIKRINSRIVAADTHKQRLILANGDEVSYDKLIIATGSRPKLPGIPGEELDGVQGLYHLGDLDNMTHKNQSGIRHAVIAGGGLIGVEMAEMLHYAGVPVTMIIREKSYWGNVLPSEESRIVTDHLAQKGIKLKTDEEISAICGTDGKVSSVICKNSGEEVFCDFCGITIGVEPNINLFRTTNIKIGRGILVNDYLETSCENVYAIGDCAELATPSPGRRSVEAVWYAARAMGETVAQTLCGKRSAYMPGIWLNSAKFFDVEYQVYGDIPAFVPEGVTTLFWKHPAKARSIRINFDSRSGAVLGFNLMGIRYRQDVCLKWIQERTPITTVLENLHLANFDPEFFVRHETEAVRVFREWLSLNVTHITL